MGLSAPFFNVFFQEELNTATAVIGTIFFVSMVVGLPFTMSAPGMNRRFGPTLTVVPLRALGAFALGAIGLWLNFPLAVALFMVSIALESMTTPTEMTFATNHLGPFQLTRGLTPLLCASAPARVINVASMYARFGSPRNPAYGASKAGVEQLTKSLAIAWAEDGIRVNAIAPGFIVTEQSARARQDPAFTKAIEARTPLARWGQPGDIAGTALFLASDAAAFITGACIPVDGGYSVV